MPTKKGKSKPAKARKATNKMRRSRAGSVIGASKRARTTARKKSAAPPRTGTRPRGSGKVKRTEAGPVFIGGSPEPVARPTEERGGRKAGDSGAGSVRIL
jgi:hypothetical protein